MAVCTVRSAITLKMPQAPLGLVQVASLNHTLRPVAESLLLRFLVYTKMKALGTGCRCHKAIKLSDTLDAITPGYGSRLVPYSR